MVGKREFSPYGVLTEPLSGLGIGAGPVGLDLVAVRRVACAEVSDQPHRSADRTAKRLIVIDHDYPSRHLPTALFMIATIVIEPDLLEGALKEV